MAEPSQSWLQILKESLKNLINPMIKARPDFLIVGPQRFNAPSLYSYLTQHPGTLSNRGWREVHHFENPQNYRQGIGSYLQAFPYRFQARGKRVFEATPLYLYYPFVPELIRQDLGKIQVIILLQEPIARAYLAWKMHHSYHKSPHEFLRKVYDAASFSEAIEREIKGECWAGHWPYHYLDRGKYVYQVENYLRTFPREDILIARDPQTLKEFEVTLAGICDFLGLEQVDAEAIASWQEESFHLPISSLSESESRTWEMLREYFAPFNEKLYALIGTRYDW